MLATGSWDKVVKVMNAKEDYITIGSFTEHEAAIVGIEFWDNGGELFLISYDCAGTIIMRCISRDLQFS